VAASPCGNHLAQVWQVGEGVSPTLDAKSNIRLLSTDVECRADNESCVSGLRTILNQSFCSFFQNAKGKVKS
jgi:hypothetical protein